MRKNPEVIPSKGEEALALHIAEMSDLSVKQARELIARHGNDLKKIEEIARNYKAES